MLVIVLVSKDLMVTEIKTLPPGSSIELFAESKSKTELTASAFAHMYIPGGGSEGPGAPLVEVGGDLTECTIE